MVRTWRYMAANRRCSICLYATLLCLLGVSTPQTLVSTRGTSGHRVFVKEKEFMQFLDKQYVVRVEDTWAALLRQVQANKIALIRAPPKSGKSTLGMLASRGHVRVVSDMKYEVRYCPNLAANSQYLLHEFGFSSIAEMASHSRKSAEDAAKPTVVYFFDETHEIPEPICQHFVKEDGGFAIFATSTVAIAEGGYITPMELQPYAFYLKSAANLPDVTQWLSGRFAALFDTGTSRDVDMATELVLNLCDSQIGVIQFLGTQLEDRGCRNFDDVRFAISILLDDSWEVLSTARCFGIGNGPPTPDQSLLVSMLRCSGELKYVDETGACISAWDHTSREHRLGLTKAFYAPTVRSQKILVPMNQAVNISFVHPLQPELYGRKFSEGVWKSFAHTDRWILNFSHTSTTQQSRVPTNVVDLVVSWLSNIETRWLLDVQSRSDAGEVMLHAQFRRFCLQLGLPCVPNFPVGGGYLDFFVAEDIGVEFLIRSSDNNELGASQLLSSAATRKALIEHSARADEAAARHYRQKSYASVARNCSKGYATVLVATLTGSDAHQEWQHFQEVINDLSSRDTSKGILNSYMIVAIASFGWRYFDVFLHQPGKTPIRFEVLRQRLMLKVMDGQPQCARHFYPRPNKVWVQEINAEGETVKEPFRVVPQDDSIEGLREALELKTGIGSLRQLSIHQLGSTGKWQWIHDTEQVLLANRRAKPYGFLITEGGSG